MKKKDGVSNVVASIMVLGIMTSILGMIFTTYIPAMAESIQYEHQVQVSEDFIELKNHIDVLIVRKDVGVTMSTSFSLGDQGGPVMSVGHSSGGLTFNPDVSEVVIEETAAVPANIFEKGRGEIVYFSGYDRIPNKDYHFEHDAIIIEQEGTAVMKVEPNIFLMKDVTGDVHLSYASISFSGESISINGYKAVTVTTTLVSHQQTTYVQGGTTGIDDVSIEITTSYPGVWEDFFRTKAFKGGLTEGAGNDFTITTTATSVTLNLESLDRMVSTSAVIEVAVTD